MPSFNYALNGNFVVVLMRGGICLHAFILICADSIAVGMVIDMIYFLTSSPCVVGSPALNPMNGFVEELQRVLSEPCSALFICSDPDQPCWTECGFTKTLPMPTAWGIHSMSW